LTVAALLALAVAPHQARADQAPLFIGYELPKNPDLAGDAMALESKCMNARDTVDQACSNGSDPSQCQQRAEISFRRCVGSIPGAKFWIAGRVYPGEKNVDLLFPLSADEATDPDLVPDMEQLRSADRFSATGLYAQVDRWSCSLHRSSDGAQASYGDPHLCQALQAALFNRSILPVVPLKGIPLLVAITSDNQSLAWSLLERGALSDASAGQAAQCSTSIGDPQKWRDMVQLLIDHGVDVNVTLPVLGRQSLLDTAIERNDVGMVKYLLEKGADIGNGTPLLQAVAKDNLEMAKLLIKNGADVSSPEGVPLALAARSGDLALVKLLVANGAEVNVIPHAYLMAPDGMPALIEAVRGKHLEVAKWLLQHGAEVDIADRNTPGRQGVVVDRSQAYYKINVGGWPALLYAVQGGDTAMVKLLVAHKPYLAGKGSHMSGPLWWGVKSGNSEMVKYLIAHGADPNECVDAGWPCNPTPLQEAAKRGDLDMVRVLVKHGAKVNGEGAEIGATPVWVAQSCGHGEVADFLKKHDGTWGVRLNFDSGTFHCDQ
jgi:ankyrin repeat protein